MKSAISKSTIFGVVLTLAAFGAAAALYNKLPNLLTVHWNMKAQADGYWAKPQGVYFYPILIAAMLLLKLVLPVISPRAFAIEPFTRAFNILMTAFMLFGAYVMGFVYANALGAHLPVGQAVIAGIGALFIVIGNFLGKTTKNFFIGFRTPWSLDDEEVWLRTHRLGGWLFVLAGVITIIVAILGSYYKAALVALGIAALAPLVYSFVLGMIRKYRKAQDQESEQAQ